MKFTAGGGIGNLLLIAIFAAYALARVLEVFSGTIPHLQIVALDVLSAAAFALVDGSRRHGWRGILIFVAICIAVGNVVENLGVATGFPFGHYRFLELMGPKIGHVPVLLGLAYIGMAYASWVMARLILNRRGVKSGRFAFVAAPLLASLIMTTWDIAQDPVWSTVLHGWVWFDGGAWFGVPLTNFLGWFGNLFIIYSLFALYLRREDRDERELEVASWTAPVLYALCAAGNVLQLASASATATVMDAAGRQWRVAHILAASALVSIAAMGSFVFLACRSAMSKMSNRSLREQA